jgi:hypothetical protein
MEREEHGVGFWQTLQNLTKGVLKDGFVEFHFYIGLCGHVFLIVANDAQLIAMMVLAEVIGNRVEPGAETIALVVFLSSSIESQKGVVHEVGSKVGIIAKPSDEETLQPSGMAVVEFLEGAVAASCSP